MNSLKELSTTDYGLIGYPLEHSFSKKFFTELFASRGEKKSYDNFALPELTPEALYSLVLLNPCLKGFNVTAPYKESVMQYLDSTDPVATEAGAVNTVRVVRDAGGRVLRLEGFNTDVEGFRESIRPFVEDFAQGTGAIVLGTGGASKAAVTALRQLGLSPVRVSRCKGGDGIVSYSDLDGSAPRGSQRHSAWHLPRRRRLSGSSFRAAAARRRMLRHGIQSCPDGIYATRRGSRRPHIERTRNATPSGSRLP